MESQAHRKEGMMKTFKGTPLADSAMYGCFDGQDVASHEGRVMTVVVPLGRNGSCKFGDGYHADQCGRDHRLSRDRGSPPFTSIVSRPDNPESTMTPRKWRVLFFNLTPRDIHDPCVPDQEAASPFTDATRILSSSRCHVSSNLLPNSYQSFP